MLDKASFNCSWVTAITLSIFMIGRSELGTEVDIKVVITFSIWFGVIWGISYVLSTVLLRPLLKLFQSRTKSISLIIFSTIGFSAPVFFILLFSLIPAHGNTPIIFTETYMQIAISIVPAGLAGLSGAVASWFTLNAHSLKGA